MNKALLLLVGAVMPAFPQPQIDGKLMVAGKAIKLTSIYAYAKPGFFDKKKEDTILVLADRPVQEAQARDHFGLMRLVDGGKLCFVQETIDADGAIINVTIGCPGFDPPMSGASTEHKFEGKVQGGKITGKVYTKGVQKAPFGGPQYEYLVTFDAPVTPKK